MTQVEVRAAVVVLAALLAGCGRPHASPVAARPETRPLNRNTVLITGDIRSTGALSIDELAGLGAEDFTYEHDGSTRTMRGTPMEAVLRRFGWDVGPGGKEAAPPDRRTGWRHAVLATSAEGYRMAFSTAELTAENGPSKVFVVWEDGGKPLDAAVGPIRLVVPTDKKGARSVRGLVELRVVDLGK